MSRASSNFEATSDFADRHFVNLLEVPKFSSISHMCLNDESKKLRLPWFADFRYCWNLSLPHHYPSVQSSVFKSDM